MKFSEDNYGSIETILNTLPALPFADKDQLPRTPGIYLVVNSSFKIIYIGKTTNFFTRWLSHHKIPEITELSDINDIIIVYSEIDESEIGHAEAILISKFMPVLNVSKPAIYQSSQFEEWQESTDTSIANIPEEIKLLVYHKNRCHCAICGEIVEEKKLRITRYHCCPVN